MLLLLSYFYLLSIILCVCNFLGGVERDEKESLKQIWVRKENSWKIVSLNTKSNFPKVAGENKTRLPLF